MTEAIPATPGWVDARLDELFAPLPPTTRPARDAFAACLAQSKEPGEPSDQLGAGFERCHATLRRAIMATGVDAALLDRLMSEAEALEAEIDADS